MVEGEFARVEERPLECRRQSLAGTSVPIVPDDGVADGGEVDADLVRAAGLERAVEERQRDRVAELAHDLVPGAGGAARDGDRHLRTVTLRTTDRRVDHPGRRVEVAPHEGGVPARGAALGELRDEGRVRTGRPRDHEQAGGAAVETVAVRPDGEREVRFVGISAEEAIARFGLLPLPPYITRDADQEDEDRYQTVYADREGSVAAPTAGLHFTPQLLDTLRAGGVTVAPLDLEVGPGTFKPVEEEDPHQHPMHEEQFEIPEATAKAVATARTSGKSVWAVGTTVVRALEAAALGESHATRLLIMPGHQFRSVDHLVTNFHLPRSTLLMLVAAFAGYDLIMRAYEHAVRQKYRFYSYGDAMVIV